jgi:hypothetical protein
LEKTNELGEVFDTLETRMKLSFYSGRVTSSSSWSTEEILGKAEDLVTNEQIANRSLDIPKDPITSIILGYPEDPTVELILEKTEDSTTGITFKRAEC